MVWSWSHTTEGLDIARENLTNEKPGWLATALAEWQLQDKIGEEGSVSWAAGEVTLNALTRRNLAEFTNDGLIEAVWNRAQGYATCDNGGFNLWVCPSGCHTVTPDND